MLVQAIEGFKPLSTSPTLRHINKGKQAEGHSAGSAFGTLPPFPSNVANGRFLSSPHPPFA